MVEFFKILAIYSSALVGIGAFIIYLGKNLFKLILDKDVEKYKAKLVQEIQISQLKLDKEIEAFKTDLVNESYKHGKLHDRTLQVIEELYEKIANLEMHLRELVVALSVSTGDKAKDKELEFEKIRSTADIYNSFLEYYNRKRIYLPKATCKKLDDLRLEAFNCLWEYDAKNKFAFNDAKFNYENYKSAADRARNTIPSMKESLEDEFRELMKPKSTTANIA